jgi:hypothetical protein
MRSGSTGNGRWLTFFVIVLLALVGWFWLPRSLDQQVRRQVLAMLAQCYPDHDVQLDSAQWRPGEGLVVKGLEIIRRGSAEDSADAGTLIRIGTVVCATSVTMDETKPWPLKIDRIVVSDVEWHCWLHRDSPYWVSLHELIPKKVNDRRCPLVVLQRGRVVLHGNRSDELEEEGAIVELRDVTMRLDQPTNSRQAQLKFSAAGDGLRRLRGAFRWDVATEAWYGNTEVVDLRLDRTRVARLLSDRLPICHRIEELSGEVSASIKLRGQGAAIIKREATIDVEDGRLRWAGLPDAIEQIDARFELGNTDLQLLDAHAQMAGATLALRGRTTVQGDFANLEGELEAHVRGLRIESRLVERFPISLRNSLRSVEAEGLIDVQANARWRDGAWSIQSQAQPRGMTVRPESFPYLLRDVVGQVELGCDSQDHWYVIANQLEARASGRKLLAALRLGDRSIDDVSIRFSTEAGVPIDRSLIAALTPRGQPITRLQQFVETLALGGMVRVVNASMRRDPRGSWQPEATLEFQQGQLRYQDFPYPIADVLGRVVIRDGIVFLEGLQGSNAMASVRCDGYWNLGRGGDPFDLVFHCQDVPLDGTLRESLGPAMRANWDAMRPAGVLDQLDVRIDRPSMNAAARVRVDARQLAESGEETKPLQLHPVALPYLLEIQQGVATYADGRIEIQGLETVHGQSKLVASGNGTQDGLGQWTLDLDLREDSRVRLDQELIGALPAMARSSLTQLQVDQPLGIYGRTTLLLPGLARQSPEASWDLTLLLEGNSFGSARAVSDIRGRVLMQGERTARSTRVRGQIDVDSMFVRGVQLTEVAGPFAIEDQLLLFGRSVQDASRDSIRGEIFGGQVESDGQMDLGSSRFDSDVRLKRASLQRALADLSTGDNEAEGAIDGQVTLAGQLGSLWELRGNGSATLREASVYQWPLVLRLLSQMRVTPSVDAAFTTGDAAFQVEGDSLSLQQLDLSGDLVTLRGSGTVNLQRELDLQFRTEVSPDSLWSRALRPLRNPRYTLLMLEVTGSIDDPEVHRMGLSQVDRFGREARENLTRLPRLGRGLMR